MDYLDPEKKKAHKRRIYIGYGLFAVAIGLATLILGYLASGFSVDKSGDFIQNGLVFVDSNPNDAEVYLNGEKQQSNTDARLVIPGGSYDVGIFKPGYRNWDRSLTLEGGSLRRLTYARLIPEQLDTISDLDLRSQPTNASQSIDKRWIMLSHSDTPLSLTVVDTEQTPIGATPVIVPEALIAPLDVNGVFNFIEWSNDDRNVLATYAVGDQVQYLLIDRNNPAQSQNLTTLLAAAPGDEISLVDRENDQFFVYKAMTKLLHTASIDSGITESPILSTPLLAYTTFSDDWLLYVRESGDKGLVDVRFKRGNKDIQIKQLKTSDAYLLELAKLGSAPVMAISSPVENRAVVYDDPEKYLDDNPEAKIPVATTVLRVPSIQGLTISTDSSVILGYSETLFASHEFDTDRSYVVDLENPITITIEPRWVDGQHLIYSSGGVQNMIDFDGSNDYELVESIASLGSFYTDDIEQMITFTAPIAATETAPAVPARLTSTSLLIKEDR